MGWFYKAVDSTGCWKVHADEYDDGVTYTAFLGEPSCAGGKWAESANTPQAAIEKVKRVARKALKDLQCLVDAGLVNSKDLYQRRRNNEVKSQGGR